MRAFSECKSYMMIAIVLMLHGNCINAQEAAPGSSPPMHPLQLSARVGFRSPRLL